MNRYKKRIFYAPEQEKMPAKNCHCNSTFFCQSVPLFLTKQVKFFPVHQHSFKKPNASSLCCAKWNVRLSLIFKMK